MSLEILNLTIWELEQQPNFWLSNVLEELYKEREVLTKVDCTDLCKNATGCSGLVSSNGHTTWCTPLPKEGDWDNICNYDLEGICPPHFNDGKPMCAGFQQK